jgi:hypothetical protein
MSSPLIDSSPLREESCSGSPNLSDGFQGGFLEKHEGQSMTPKGAKCGHEVTKDSTGCFCCNRSSGTANVIDEHDRPFKCSVPDCKRTQGFASLTSLRRHETEGHGMHNRGQKLHCPIPTCERHNGKGFQRNEQLENHIRLIHPNNGDNLGRRLKREAEIDWDGSFQDIKRLREDTRDLSNQFAAGAVQLAKMMLLIQQLQENAGTPRRDSEHMTSMIDKNGGSMTEQKG